MRKRFSFRFGSVLAAAVASVLVVGGVAPVAGAADPLLGSDVAQPQCVGQTAAQLPPVPSFAVVGVNGGVANTTNSCLAAQISWGSAAPGGGGQPGLAFYVNTANPALAGSWWPDSNSTQPSTPGVSRIPVTVANPYGRCAHGADAACAFVYGFSMALDDATVRGVPDPANRRWWLDVETINTWQSNKAANRASLEGMAVYFRGIGASVGVYSTPAHWAEIVGTVPATSPLATLPSWRALGPVSHASARKACGKPSFTPRGRVVMTQFVSGGFDWNVACQKLSSAPKPKVKGTAAVGHSLKVVKRAWKPGKVALSYRWLRNGKPIAKATHSTYTLKKADAGKRISVRVTGEKTGYATIVKSSSAKKVKR
jgi:hypothetical protein